MCESHVWVNGFHLLPLRFINEKQTKAAKTNQDRKAPTQAAVGCFSPVCSSESTAHITDTGHSTVHNNPPSHSRPGIHCGTAADTGSRQLRPPAEVSYPSQAAPAVSDAALGVCTFELSGPRGWRSTVSRGALASSRLMLFKRFTSLSGRGAATALAPSLQESTHRALSPPRAGQGAPGSCSP